MPAPQELAVQLVLDHIVILVPPSLITNPPEWLATAFHITPGGRHANNLTFNSLILFRDGVYVELIAFVEGASEAERRDTRWGRRVEGEIVDFAFTLLPAGGGLGVSTRGGGGIGVGGIGGGSSGGGGSGGSSGGSSGSSGSGGSGGDSGGFGPEEVFRQEVQSRVRKVGREFDTGWEYLDPVAGGRITPGGKELKWAVAVPLRHQVDAHVKVGDGMVEGEGRLPFWCLDRTPRDWRVPFKSGGAEHVCGAVGVAGVEVAVKEDGFVKLRRVYESFLGEWFPASAETDKSAKWEVKVPDTVSSQLTSTLAIRGDLKEEDDMQVRISLRLFTRGPSGVVAGEIAPGRMLEIELIHVS